MSAAEQIYTANYISGSSSWSNNINLEGFTYFAYTHQTNISLSNNLEPLKN